MEFSFAKIIQSISSAEMNPLDFDFAKIVAIINETNERRSKLLHEFIVHNDSVIHLKKTINIVIIGKSTTHSRIHVLRP